MYVVGVITLFSVTYTALNNPSYYPEELMGFQHRYPPYLNLAFHDMVTASYVVPVK